MADIKIPSKIYLNHTGKVASKWKSYLDKWDKYFPEYAKTENCIIEIGVQNGGSLEILAEYFTEAKFIIGCDIDPICNTLKFEDSRIKVFIGNINSKEIQKEIIELQHPLDIIIDDGSHICGDVIKSFSLYFPLLAHNGLYIIEDLHASYWKSHEGSLFNPYTSMNFFKRLCDILNIEHWRNGLLPNDFLHNFANKYDFEIIKDSFYEIHSIEFFNSMCFIKKKKKPNNLLDPLVTVGTDSTVTDAAGISLEGWNSIYQLYSEIEDDSNLDCFTLIGNKEKQSQEITELNQVINKQSQEITELNQVINKQSQEIIKLNQVANNRSHEIIGLYQVTKKQSQEIIELNQVANIRNHENDVLKRTINDIYSSRTWRYGSKIAKLINKFLSLK